MTVTVEGDDLLAAARLYVEKLMPERMATGAKLILSRAAVEVEMEARAAEALEQLLFAIPEKAKT